MLIEPKPELRSLINTLKTMKGRELRGLEGASQRVPATHILDVLASLSSTV